MLNQVFARFKDHDPESTGRISIADFEIIAREFKFDGNAIDDMVRLVGSGTVGFGVVGLMLCASEVSASSVS